MISSLLLAAILLPSAVDIGIDDVPSWLIEPPDGFEIVVDEKLTTSNAEEHGWEPDVVATWPVDEGIWIRAVASEDAVVYTYVTVDASSVGAIHTLKGWVSVGEYEQDTDDSDVWVGRNFDWQAVVTQSGRFTVAMEANDFVDSAALRRLFDAQRAAIDAAATAPEPSLVAASEATGSSQFELPAGVDIEELVRDRAREDSEQPVSPSSRWPAFAAGIIGAAAIALRRAAGLSTPSKSQLALEDARQGYRSDTPIR